MDKNYFVKSLKTVPWEKYSELFRVKKNTNKFTNVMTDWPVSSVNANSHWIDHIGSFLNANCEGKHFFSPSK